MVSTTGDGKLLHVGRYENGRIKDWGWSFHPSGQHLGILGIKSQSDKAVFIDKEHNTTYFGNYNAKSGTLEVLHGLEWKVEMKNCLAEVDIVAGRSERKSSLELP